MQNLVEGGGGGKDGNQCISSGVIFVYCSHYP